MVDQSRSSHSGSRRRRTARVGGRQGNTHRCGVRATEQTVLLQAIEDRRNGVELEQLVGVSTLPAMSQARYLTVVSSKR